MYSVDGFKLNLFCDDNELSQIALKHESGIIPDRIYYEFLGCRKMALKLQSLGIDIEDVVMLATKITV